MTEEGSFQKYFLKTAAPTQRIPADGNPGIPDTEVIRGLNTYRVELKVLHVGVSGNKKVFTVFKDTQPPYYAKFLVEKQGKGLYVLFKLNEGYGLLEVDMAFVRDIRKIYYKDLPNYKYKEYKVLQEVINENFPFSN